MIIIEIFCLSELVIDYVLRLRKRNIFFKCTQSTDYNLTNLLNAYYTTIFAHTISI